MPVPPDRYADKSWNETLEHYRTRLPAATLLFPSAALGMLQKLSNSTDGRMLVLAADKGCSMKRTSRFSRVRRSLSSMPRHCFSQLVNFDAIARYFYGIGGDALLPQKRFSSLSICAFLAHHSDDKFPATRAAYQETQSTFGSDDLFALMSWLNAHLGRSLDRAGAGSSAADAVGHDCFSAALSGDLAPASQRRGRAQ